MGKRTLGESDSEDSSDDEENEKSIVLNTLNQLESDKEAGGSSDSVNGGKQEEQCSGNALCESGSGAEKDALVDQILESSTPKEIDTVKENTVVEVEEEITTCSGAAEVSGNDAPKAEKHENVGPDSQTLQVSSPTEPIESKSATSDLKSDGEAVVTNVKDDSSKPLNFDEFNSAAEMEVCLLLALLVHVVIVCECISLSC